jgi:hypothetical protein
LRRRLKHLGKELQNFRPKNFSICPVNCVHLYIDHTSEFRTAHKFFFLFISSTNPHKAVSLPTIGRWIKSQLGMAAIDTSSFSTHSTRGATASKAARKGLPIQTILDHGHWARESIFARFYHREMEVGPSNPIGNSVLRVAH